MRKCTLEAYEQIKHGSAKSMVVSKKVQFPFMIACLCHSCLFSIAGQRWSSDINCTRSHQQRRRGNSFKKPSAVTTPAINLKLREMETPICILLCKNYLTFWSIFRLPFRMQMRTFHWKRGRHCLLIMVSNASAPSVYKKRHDQDIPKFQSQDSVLTLVLETILNPRIQSRIFI